MHTALALLQFLILFQALCKSVSRATVFRASRNCATPADNDSMECSSSWRGIPRRQQWPRSTRQHRYISARRCGRQPGPARARHDCMRRPGHAGEPPAAAGAHLGVLSHALFWHVCGLSWLFVRFMDLMHLHLWRLSEQQRDRRSHEKIVSTILTFISGACDDTVHICVLLATTLRHASSTTHQRVNMPQCALAFHAVGAVLHRGRRPHAAAAL